MKTVREYDKKTDFSKIPERKGKKRGGSKSKLRSMLEERMR